MAEPKEDDFLDDIEKALEEEFEQDMAEISDEEAEIDTLRAERDALQDKFMRALADAENARKRSDKDRRDMLPVYDNMKRALEAATEEQRKIAGPLFEGIELTMRELRNVFGKHGITVISPQVGDRFDPQHHEAMFEAPLPDTKAGEIIQVSAEGFMLHDRILRPAQVGVSSNTG